MRQAILSANGNLGLDIITFNIPGTGPFTITPASSLPIITDPVIINATNQPGFTGTPLIEINGSNIGANNDGLVLAAGGSAIYGLAINRSPRDAIRIQGPGTNVIQGNFLGTDVTGTVARGNGEGGVMINGSVGNLIGGTNAAARNIISGGNANGLYLTGSTTIGNVIEGNYIGTSVTGLTGLSNLVNGFEISAAPGNIIGGTVSGAGNVISGNGQSGIYLLTSGATSNLIEGTFIGLNANGTGAIGNVLDGVTIYGVAGNTVGGTAAGARNIISGNGNAGVDILITGASNNNVLGNYIGTDVTGKIVNSQPFQRRDYQWSFRQHGRGDQCRSGQHYFRQPAKWSRDHLCWSNRQSCTRQLYWC